MTGACRLSGEAEDHFHARAPYSKQRRVRPAYSYWCLTQKQDFKTPIPHLYPPTHPSTLSVGWRAGSLRRWRWWALRFPGKDASSARTECMVAGAHAEAKRFRSLFHIIHFIS